MSDSEAAPLRSTVRLICLLATAGAVIAGGWVVARQRWRNDARRSDSAGVAAFLSMHHHRCESEDVSASDEFERLSAELTPSRVAALFGDVPWIEAITSPNLVFEGLGNCTVPAGGASIHLLLSFAGDQLPGVKVSVFLQRGPSTLPLDEDVAHRLEPKNRSAEEPEILAWRRGDLVCFVVSGNRNLARLVHSELDGPPEYMPSCLGRM